MTAVIVDSNILIDIFTDDQKFYDWSHGKLIELSGCCPLYINPIVYSEVSIGFSSIETLEEILGMLPIRSEEVPKEALFLAGKAFLEYRRRGGTRLNNLPDFFIGAHAAVKGWKVLSRDPKRMKKAYPGLEIISP